MSRAGGIAYLLKHGRAPLPTVTRTEMPRGMKRMAGGGTTAPANQPLNYGNVPNYEYNPSSQNIAPHYELGPDGKLRFVPGRYYSGVYGSPTSTPSTGTGTGVATGTGTGATSGDGYGERDTMPQSVKDFLENETPAERDARMGKISDLITGINTLTSPLSTLARAVYDPVVDFFTGSTRVENKKAQDAAYKDDTRSLDTPTQQAVDAAYNDTSRSLDTPTQAGISAAYGDPSRSRDTPTNERGYTEGVTTGDRSDTRGNESIGNLGGENGMGDAVGGWYHNGKFNQPAYAGGGIAALAGGGQPGQPRLLSGGGTGLSDDIPAVIGHNQPARLADGEFVVSADVVSALGGGSTKAGAKKLYAMMDRIRQNAHGTKKQVRKVNDRKVLPA